MLVVWQSPQKVQLDLFGSRILLLQGILQQALEVAWVCTGLELLHMEANAPLPHLGAMGVWNSRPNQILQFQGARHLPVHSTS